MAATKSNGVSGGERRRRRGTNGAVAGQGLASGAGEPAPKGVDDVHWLGRLDALVDRLAGLDDRAAIIDQVVGEAMHLLPADEVRVYADAATITVPSFIDENEGAPARAVIPLAIAGRHFGAVEITMKPQRAVGAGERALAIVLARQCALAIDALALRQARRASEAGSDVVEIAPSATASSPTTNLAAVQASLGRLEVDVRALAKLARNAELPPAAWVDRAELKVLRGLDETRALLGGGVQNAA